MRFAVCYDADCAFYHMNIDCTHANSARRLLKLRKGRSEKTCNNGRVAKSWTGGIHWTKITTTTKNSCDTTIGGIKYIYIYKMKIIEMVKHKVNNKYMGHAHLDLIIAQWAVERIEEINHRFINKLLYLLPFSKRRLQCEQKICKSCLGLLHSSSFDLSQIRMTCSIDGFVHYKCD